MFIQAYIQTASSILDQYKGGEPFHLFIKKYFAENKKFGSRDRRFITQLCYNFFRLGKALMNINVEERLMVALFLCNNTSHPILQKKKPEWDRNIDQELDAKIDFIKEVFQFSPGNIFPFEKEMSSTIDYEAFAKSFLIQPDVFLRIRPGKESLVKQKLIEKGVEFSIVKDSCISLKPAEKIDDLLEINKEVVVQDYSSQQVLQPLNNFLSEHELKIKTGWDCCAASGGKSILLADHYPQIQITATDIRESIIVNLRKRFKEAGIQKYKSFVADVGSPDFLVNEKFDLIICDAPCSGSGTWGRTPEQLYFFNEEKIDYYSNLQKKIALNAVKALDKQGLFLYITCSVFKKENEEVVELIKKEAGLKLYTMQYFTGYQQKADTLFAALFTTV